MMAMQSTRLLGAEDLALVKELLNSESIAERLSACPSVHRAVVGGRIRQRVLILQVSSRSDRNPPFDPAKQEAVLAALTSDNQDVELQPPIPSVANEEHLARYVRVDAT